MAIGKDIETRVYSARRHASIPALVRAMFIDLRDARGLARELALRSIKAQYRQAALGMLWTLIIPFANVVAWLFMRSSGAVTIDVAGVSYPAFVVSGVLLWSIFIDAANAPLQQVQGANQMLAKINFPREALILSGLYQTTFSATAKLVILVAALVALNIAPSLHLLFLPLVVLSLVTCGTLVGIAITPIGALYSDVGRALPLVMQFLMFLSPVVYATPKSGWAAQLMSANPLTPIIELGRSAAIGPTLTGLDETLLITFVALLLMFAAWAIFRMAMPILIERMSA